MQRQFLLFGLTLLLASALLTSGYWWWFQPQKTISNSLGMRFVKIPAGHFVMGSPENEPKRSPMGDEEPVQVTLSNPYYLQITEVTQGQWQAVMGNNPAYYPLSPAHPVENVSYEEVERFLIWLNQKEQQGHYRLPTEAEWEYAARASSQGVYAFGDQEQDLDQYAWYKANSGLITHAVASKAPNSWGLYDMYGNVYEWVSDWYQDYPSHPVIDPQGPLTGLSKSMRGGSFMFASKFSRSAQRHSGTVQLKNRGVGFRLVWEKD